MQNAGLFGAADAGYDTLLAARVAEFLFWEWRRLGRPARLLDLGTGRGTFVEALLRCCCPWGRSAKEDPVFRCFISG